MRKRLLVWAVVCALAGLDMAPVYAQTSATGPSGAASATVPQVLEFTLSRVVRMNSAAGDTNPFTQGTVLTSPSFNFGTLARVNDAEGNFLYMRGEYYYYILMIAATSGRRYKITETGTQLTGPGGVLLPKESVLLVPDYQWLDTLGTVAQGAPPGNASVGPVASASNTGSLVYQSDTAGLGRLVRSVIAISGPGAGSAYPSNYSLGFNGAVGQGAKQEYTAWKAITPDQPSGAYSGTITFTLVLN
ncbi:MAG TPA: hypothetical protein DCL35_03810 [Candidatus Omnitrophica bacterium]|nr:hypothetical protein [Candidatus Omnitrophota bacterium]